MISVSLAHQIYHIPPVFASFQPLGKTFFKKVLTIGFYRDIFYHDRYTTTDEATSVRATTDVDTSDKVSTVVVNQTNEARSYSVSAERRPYGRDQF